MVEDLPPAEAELDAWLLEQAGLDFPTPQRCEVHHTEGVCPDPAEWIGICVMCDRAALHCDKARAEFDLEFAEGSRFGCISCGAVTSIAHPRYRFVRLEGDR